jgi:hypothetical protein
MLPPRNSMIGKLPIVGAASWRTRLTWNDNTQQYDKDSGPWYAIFFGVGMGGFPEVAFYGYRGSDVYVSAATPGACNYDPANQYCAQLPTEAEDPASETFYGMPMGDVPVVVRHNVNPPNWPSNWTATWYVSDREITYTLILTGCSGACDAPELAGLIGNSNLSPDNRASAERIVSLVSAFITVPLATPAN